MTQLGGDATTDAPPTAEAPPSPDGDESPWPAGPGVVTTSAYRGKHLAEPRGPSTSRSIIEWILVLGGALIVALLIRNFLFTTFWIPSESMQPTLIGDPRASGRHDRVVVNRLSYTFHDVRRGDIVVFSTPPSEVPVTENGRKIKDLIKRVIGLPGETVSLRGHHVYIDDKLLDEPYLPDGVPTDPICERASSFKVPEDSVFVMGDNRTNSQDGRCFGPIKRKTILGRAFVRIWPLTKITWL